MANTKPEREGKTAVVSKEDFDFDKALAAIKKAATELAKPEVKRSFAIVNEGAHAAAAVQDAMKAVSIQDAVKAVAIQDAVKAVAIQDAVKAVAIQDAMKAVGIQDAAKAVAIQDAVKAVVVGMAGQDWSTPEATERLQQALEIIRSTSRAVGKPTK